MKITLKNEQEKIIELFVFTVFLQIFIFCINAIGRVTIGETPYDTALVYGVYVIYVLRAWRSIVKKFSRNTIMLVIAIGIHIAYAILMNDQINKEQDMFKTSLFCILSGIIFGAAITDWDLCLKKLTAMTRIGSVLMITAFVLYNYVLKIHWGEGMMGLSYRLLIVAILCMYSVLKKFNVIDLILLIVLLAIMLLQGSRGPFLSVILYFIMYIMTNYRKYTLKIIFIFGVFVLIAAFVYMNLDSILMQLDKVATENQFEAKIIRWALEGNITELNGRDRIMTEAIDMIKERPLYGYGMFGDREIIESYCHNVFLELMVDFGGVWGVIISAFIIIGVIKALIHCSQAQRDVITILVGMFIFKLLMSGTFWTEFAFFMILTMAINNAERKRLLI